MLLPVTVKWNSYNVMHTSIKKIGSIAMTFSPNQELETSAGENMKNFIVWFAQFSLEAKCQ